MKPSHRDIPQTKQELFDEVTTLWSEKDPFFVDVLRVSGKSTHSSLDG